MRKRGLREAVSLAPGHSAKRRRKQAWSPEHSGAACVSEEGRSWGYQAAEAAPAGVEVPGRAAERVWGPGAVGVRSSPRVPF